MCPHPLCAHKSFSVPLIGHQTLLLSLPPSHLLQPPPLLRSSRPSVLLSSTSSPPPPIRAFQPPTTTIASLSCFHGLVLCSKTQPTLHLWHQAVLQQTPSSLINITTPVPLRAAAPSILCCTLALRDVITRLLAGSAPCHLLTSPSFRFFFLTMDLSCPFLSLRFTSDPIFLPKPPNGPGQERTISQDVLPHFLYRVFCCPAGEFLKQLSAYHSVS